MKTAMRYTIRYNNYEAVIHGFVVVFTAIRYVDYDHIEHCLRRGLHLQMNKRT